MHVARSFETLSVEKCLWLISKSLPPRRPYLAEDRLIYLYGKGNLGELAENFLDRVGRRVVGVFDQSSSTAGINATATVVVAVVTCPYVLIERWLLARDVCDAVPFYDFANTYFCGQHPLAGNGWYVEKYTPEEQGKTYTVLQRWGDDISRKHHLQFLAWRAIREEWTFANAPVTNENRYFIPEVVSVLHGHEVFFDGGAHHGEVSKRFIDVVGGKHKQIIAIEPDYSSYKVLIAALPESIHCALGSWNGVQGFDGGYGYASRLKDDVGNTQVAMRAIDSLGVEPTFVKLHLEGGELNALRGAKDTLQKQRPIIAATVYHNDDGIYRTAEWLMSELDGYRFLFRNHCWQGAGAVVYAIPNERAR